MNGPSVAIKRRTILRLPTATSIRLEKCMINRFQQRAIASYAFPAPFSPSAGHSKTRISNLVVTRIHSSNCPYSSKGLMMDASAKAGHDLLHFVNASPTRESIPSNYYQQILTDASLPCRLSSQTETREGRVQTSTGSSHRTSRRM